MQVGGGSRSAGGGASNISGKYKQSGGVRKRRKERRTHAIESQGYAYAQYIPVALVWQNANSECLFGCNSFVFLLLNVVGMVWTMVAGWWFNGWDSVYGALAVMRDYVLSTLLPKSVYTYLTKR